MRCWRCWPTMVFCSCRCATGAICTFYLASTEPTNCGSSTRWWPNTGFLTGTVSDSGGFQYFHASAGTERGHYPRWNGLRYSQHGCLRQFGGAGQRFQPQRHRNNGPRGGHALGLFHTFEPHSGDPLHDTKSVERNKNASCWDCDVDGDYVCDTPPTLARDMLTVGDIQLYLVPQTA